MLKISPMCWVFGHSKRMNVLVEIDQIRAVSVDLHCARCDEPIQDRMARLTVSCCRVIRAHRKQQS